MGKTKKLDEVFTLKKELRECHETITTLEKQLLRFQKESAEPKLTKAEKKQVKLLTESRSDPCPKCEEGYRVYASLGVREIITCSKKCGYREIVKTNGKEKKEI